jgi:hypothetical protein
MKVLRSKMLATATLIIPLTVAQGVDAAEKVDEPGVIVCVSDKWDEKEIGKNHKVVDYAGRCVKVPDAASANKTTEECNGKYEYKPDGTWQAAGTCLVTVKEGETMSIAWQEGSGLDLNTYQANGGTGRFKGVTGGGTYKYDQLTTTLFGGRYHSKWELP